MRATDLLARWASKDPPPLKHWIPEFAVDKRRGVPQWVRDDLKLGVELGLVSQPLYDALRDLEDGHG